MQHIAKTIVAAPVGVLDYLIPESLSDNLAPGMAVRVPLGKRECLGYVYEIQHTNTPSSHTLRTLADQDTQRPALPQSLLSLIVGAAEYYKVTAGEMLQAALPPAVRQPKDTYRITAAGKAFISTLSSEHPAYACLAFLHKRTTPVSIKAWAAQCGLSKATLAQRVKKYLDAGWVTKTQTRGSRPVKETTDTHTVVQHTSLPLLTEEQTTVLSALYASFDTGVFHTCLLQGVTGSGKTEVYLQLIAHCLKQGKNALVLVPEIALTPQLHARFEERFGDQVALFHSSLTEAQRKNQWQKISSQKARIGLGARSALFLPMHHVGVIIVDEEHETSFKQDETPRYHARDMAVLRGKYENATVVLGSATPSVESTHNAHHKKYQHLVLSKRVHQQAFPEVQCIELRSAQRVSETSFTQPLAQAIEETLSQQQQVILFLNRRGFAPYVVCRDCTHAFRCASCDISLTLHRKKNILLCHYCGHQQTMPHTCPMCASNRLDSFGLGTERVETELRTLFPQVPIARLDRDTIRKHKDLQNTLNTFRAGDTRILIGTQMVAKGHDFPNVTLVGVINADASLNFPDFRAAERTFQTLTQVSGRAGRGHLKGRVLLQAHETSHYALQAALTHDYERFYSIESEHRRDLLYPPYGFLALLRIESEDEVACETHAQTCAACLTEHAQKNTWPVSVLGPAPAPISRLMGLHRKHILLKSASRAALHQVLRAFNLRAPTSVRQILDIDPIHML
jgi:primosomal protein N' (replication factor Y)